MMRLFSSDYRPIYTIRYWIPQVTLSPRRLLFYNNIILLICSLALSGFSIYLCVIFSSQDTTTTHPKNQDTNGTWLNWLFLVLEGFLLGIIAIIGMRGGELVDVSLLLAYFWLLVVFIAPVVLTTVACFDFYQYLSIWFEHNWESSTFSGIRHIFCQENTADTLCSVPLNVANATDWCVSHYQAVACLNIRENAISEAITLGTNYTLALGIIGILNLLEIGFSMYLCTRILTHSVITESMNDIMSFLLVLPIAGCVGIGSYVWRLRQLTYFSWFPYFFIGMGSLQVIALPIGVIAGRLKSRPMLLFYIFLATITCGGLGSAGVMAFLFAGIVTHELKPTIAEKDNLACAQNFASCCCCDPQYNVSFVGSICPEWSTTDVVSLLQLDLKITGVVALVCMVYLVGALTVAGLLNTDLQNYKTDYV